MNEKKGKYYSVICLFIAVCFLMSVIPASAVNVSEVAEQLNQIAEKYPDGSFFSVDGQACIHTHNLTCSNCELLKICPELKGKVSNAWTCCAFARYVYYELFHINSYSISSNSKEVSLADAKAGDLVMFYNGSSITHYAIYLYSDGVTGKYYLYESDYIVPNKVRYRGAYSAVQLTNVKIWHANNYDADVKGNVPEANMSTPTPVSTPEQAMAPLPSIPQSISTLIPTITTASTTTTPTTMMSLTPTPTPTPTSTPTQVPTSSQIPASKPVITSIPIVLPIPNSKPDSNLNTPPMPTQTQSQSQAQTQAPLSLSIPNPKPAPITQTQTQSQTTKNTQITVTSIKMSKIRLKLGEGKSYKLNGTIFPQKASNKKVKWSSNNKSIAIVSSEGLVKGVKKGKTYIYVTSVDGKKEASCIVIVY